MVKVVPIAGYWDYEINELGEVTSYKRVHPRKLKPYIAGNGYYEVALSPEKGVYKRIALHRLLALHFIPNPLNLECVNHKDGNPLNNNLDNLEWVTHSENTRHYVYGPNSNANLKPITVDGVRFPSLKKCAEHYEINAKNLSSQLKKGIIPRKLRGKQISFD